MCFVASARNARAAAGQDEQTLASTVESAQLCKHVNTNNMPNACPPAPSPSTESSPCRNGYAEKYKACGGRIEKVEK